MAHTVRQYEEHITATSRHVKGVSDGFTPMAPSATL
jgi:hypothetical protein